MLTQRLPVRLVLVEPELFAVMKGTAAQAEPDGMAEVAVPEHGIRTAHFRQAAEAVLLTPPRHIVKPLSMDKAFLPRDIF